MNGSAELEPELMAALAATGADLLQSGVREYEPWRAKLLAGFGEKFADRVRVHLPELYTLSQEELRLRQGRCQAVEGSPADPVPYVRTQADGDTGQAHPVAAANRETGVSRWRTWSLASGLAVVLALIAGVLSNGSRHSQKRVGTSSRPDLVSLESGTNEVGGALAASNSDSVVDKNRALAERGQAAAQAYLGWCYDSGQGVPQDYREAVRWYRKAADQGHANAQHNLGVCYAKGKGVAQDYSEAVTWYRRAADQERPGAQYHLGACYRDGDGVQQDHAEAAKWFRKAAIQGNRYAQFNLGMYYQSGTGVAQDYAEAAKWYRKAADQGHATAQCSLGMCYRNGDGVQQDHAEAAKWFRKAAVQGNPYAQNGLGVCYAKGKGVAQDYSEAVTWYRRAADQGYSEAQVNLGVCYYFGHGVPQNDIEAYKWWCLAAAQGEEGSAECRDQVYQRMARAEVVEGQRRAAAFVANKKGGGGGSGDTLPRPELAEGKRSAGSGFFVTDDGYFVTCEHVVHGATSFFIKSSSGSLPARLIKKNRMFDVALLKVDGAFRALPVAAQPRVKLGDAVFTVGFPNPGVQGVKPKLTRGEISSMAGVQDNPHYYQISAQVQPGNSGGALVDESGNVVGVVTSRLDDVATYEASGALPQNVNYAVKGGLVHAFLSRIPELSGKLRAPSTAKDREAASASAERAAVLVVAE